jgi:hypothetical protein
VAWRLAYEHWGQGYATEAASAWHEAQVEDEGQTFEAVVYSITAERWREHRNRDDQSLPRWPRPFRRTLPSARRFVRSPQLRAEVAHDAS